jgi:hypothetical protein
MTDALWWLVCMREALEPSLSENGGTFANKPGSHNAGENLPDHGQGNRKTDHSIRDSFNRTGPWWRKFCAAHDWTFFDAQRGDYRTITKYTKQLIKAMKDPKDLRPDDVYFYTLGQVDNDSVVEGYNERDDDDETSSDKTHNWHRHDSFRRNIIGNFWALWKALTIDMGWTYDEWLRSTKAEPLPVESEEDLPVNQTEFNKLFLGAMKDPAIKREVGEAVLTAGVGNDVVPQRDVRMALSDFVNGLRAVLWFPPGHQEANAANLIPGSPLARIIDNAMKTPPAE